MNHPYVGVGVVIYNVQGQVLLGKRKGAHGAGHWAFPGGHLEFGEEVAMCAKREVIEETGLLIDRVSPLRWTNDIFKKEGKYYVTLFVVGYCIEGSPELLEPNKCEGWQWFSPDNLPSPLFRTIEHLLAEEGDNYLLKFARVFDEDQLNRI